MPSGARSITSSMAPYLPAEILRRKTITERVAMILDANATMRKLIEGPLRAKHPDWNDEQIQREVARRMLCDAR